MICAEHEDGRIVLMASEQNLKPMILDFGGWGPASISGEELNEFTRLDNPNIIEVILESAKKFANLNSEFKINNETN